MSDDTSSGLNRSSTFRRDGAILNDTYVIERLIKAGGMGQVYRGRRLDDELAVAIKIIKPEFLNDRAALSFFQREAEALRELTRDGGSDAIVQFHAFDEERGTQRKFLVMEYVDGPSLSERMRTRPLDHEEVVTLAHRVASGLLAAHERGIIHRDLSPDNILLSNSRLDQAKIIDLGVARMRDSDTTTFLGFAGKNNYASPEQVGLYGGKAFEKSDVYSLALVLAAAARGEAMDMAGNLAEVVRKRQSVPDLTEFDARLRPLLEPMLEPDPDRRWSMRDIIDWCERQAGGQAVAQAAPITPRSGPQAPDAGSRREPPPIIVPSASTLAQPAPRPSRSRMPVIVGATVAMLAAGGVGGWMFVTSQSTIQRVDPEAERLRQEAATREAERQRQEAAAREADRQRQEAATQEAERQRQEAATRDAERQRQEAAARDADRQRQEAAARDAERERQEAAAKEAERQRQEAAARDAERQRQDAAAREAERLRLEAAAREAERLRQEAAKEDERLRQEAERLRQETSRLQQEALAREAERQRQEAAAKEVERLRLEEERKRQEAAAAKPAFDPKDREVIREMQALLKTVGCYFGGVDGSEGPMTNRARDAAISRLRLTVPGVSEALLTALRQDAARPNVTREPLCPRPQNPPPLPNPPVNGNGPGSNTPSGVVTSSGPTVVPSNGGSGPGPVGTPGPAPESGNSGSSKPRTDPGGFVRF